MTFYSVGVQTKNHLWRGGGSMNMKPENLVSPQGSLLRKCYKDARDNGKEPYVLQFTHKR